MLLVAATQAEIAPLLHYLQSQWICHSGNHYNHNGVNLQVCIGGVGMLQMSYSLSKALQGQHFDMALMAGIAGSFDVHLPLASLVQVGTEYMGDLGAEDHDKFLDVFELGLGNKNEFPFKDGGLVAPGLPRKELVALPWLNGITVNTVSGSNHTIQKRAQHFKCSIESMEGAAFHYTCLMEHLPFAHVRSISNYVEPRDKSKWKIKEAIIALNNWLIDFVQQ